MNPAEVFITPGGTDLDLSVPPRALTFTIWRPSQFLEYTAPIDAVILGDSIIERGKWTSLIGVGGLGKTRLALWLAVCQILGREWCGLRVYGTPLRWLILSNENGLRRWQTDLKAMGALATVGQRTMVDQYLRIMALVDDEDGDLNTGNPESMQRLSVTLREQAPDVIIFDPLSEIVDGDESRTEDMVRTLRTLRPIVRKEVPKAAALLIHHARTGSANVAQAGDNYSSGNFGRGAKALFSAMRAELQLAPGHRDNANRLVLACGKNSDGPKFPTRGLIFNPEDCSYSVDDAFNLDDWRNDVSGQRGGKACSIADAVQIVRELAPTAADEAKTSAIVEAMVEASGAGIRTCKGRLAEAVKSGYLRRGSRTGFYRLGAKPLPRQP